MYPLYPRAINRYRYNPRIDYLVNPRNPLDMYSVNRTTRELGTMTAATIVGTLVGGSAYIIKSFIELIRTDKYATKADLAKTTHQIEDLRINQIEMQQAITHIAAQTIANQNEIRQLYNGVAAQNIEVQIKSFNRYLHSVLANTLNSYAQAFLSAMDGRTSPYVLSQKELQKICSDFHSNKKITLDNNINNVKTTAVIFENHIRFFFEVPVLDKENSFNFFSIIPAPAFNNNITYWPEIDISNVAISQDGTKYTILSSEEFSRCMDIPPICRTARALMPTINKGSCVVSTYKTGTRTCPLKPSSSSPPEPFLYFVDTNLYYSVPSNTTLFVTCPADSQFSSTKEKSITISGIGEAHYKPACTITLPDGTYHKAPRKPEVQDLTDWPLFNIKLALPHEFDNTVLVHPTSPPLVVNFATIESVLSFSDGILSDHSKFFDIAVNIASIVLPLALVIIIALCCKKKLKIWVENKIYQGTHTLNRHTETAKDEFKYVSTLMTPSKAIPDPPPQKFDPIDPIPSTSFHKSPSVPSLPSILKKDPNQKNVHFRYHP